MSDNQRKMYSKKGTGTVPKIKYGNNTSLLNQDESNLVSNNLGRDLNQPNYITHLRNSGKYQTQPHYFGMDHLSEEQNISNQNGVALSSNGMSSQKTDDSVSRRNSSDTIPKCDNVTKYPDKKQIEDKLNQIREYLHITSSLMFNMKNSEEQSDIESEQLEKTYNDLKDSELKLLVMLNEIDNYDKNISEELRNEEALENGFDNLPETARLPKRVLENKVEHANRQLEMLREQENLLTTLQMKAENQLREARQAQQRLTNHNTNVDKQPFIDDVSDHNSNEMNEILSNTGGKKGNQEMIKELEERLSSLKADTLNHRPQPTFNVQEQFQAQVESIQDKITQLRDSNDNRNQLIHFLDKRDAQLQTEHMELQGKLWELQNKKMQVDQLVSQLQCMNDESEEDDIGFQVRKIVSMKEQLSKLKDMLEVVKNSENMVESQNMNESDTEPPDVTNTLTTKSDNLIQNDVRSNQFNHENMTNARLENNPTRSSNEQKVKEKQVNKKSMNANEKERLKLQAELQAKKRELEELMCKHKAASSNLNQDVPCENKSEIGPTNHSLYEGTTNSWYPMPSNLYHLPNSSERYSSDECAEDDINEYSELNSSGEASNVQMIQPMASLNYPTSNYIKHKSTEPSLEVPEPYTRTSSQTPDHSVHTATGNSSRSQRERVRSNSERDTQNKTQVQKQLELIRSVCDSILEQQNLGKEQTPVPQNVRNNLTPSPLYSEPRQYASPNPHSMNALNVVNPVPNSTWVPPNPNQANIAFNDPVGYHNWLTTNNLQTQAFMLNTLNQCCQMLWLQQRELASLRSTVAVMQEKLQAVPFDQNNSMSMYMNSNSCMYPITIPTSESRESSQIRTGIPNTKMNQVSGAGSLPNLNHPHVPPTTNTIDSAYANQNNLHNTRILDSGLNNTIHQNTVSGHVNNSLLQGVNQNLPSQIWNGQALNNQVAPGNRANNYWDNFRSYSRQNLLSTKSNEGLQNQSTTSERPNNSGERCQVFNFPSLSTQKRNPTHQESSNSSAENTPRRKTLLKSPRHSLNTDTMTTIPPDVLNINEAQTSQKLNENNDLMEMPLQIGFEPFANTFEHPDSSTNNSNVSETQESKNYPTLSSQRNRNEWNNDVNNDNVQSKSKLFDELRENVYREVACLISANQGRPHFLIQLFRDLQMVSSDPMRRKTLQSIQSLISHSLLSSTQGIFRQPTNAQPGNVDNDILANYNPTYFPANSWSQQRSNIESDSSLDTDCQDYLSEVLTFLNTHSEDILQQNLLESLKELLVECTFSTVFNNNNTKDSIIQKHFANLAADAFEQYKGRRVQDVRMNILQTIEDLLRGEISLIRLMRENISDANDLSCLIVNDATASQTSQSIQFDLSSQIPNSSSITEDCNNPPQMQNGDLAEADQSRVELDEEEEGAVGGVLNIIDECNSTIGQTDIEFTEQGLDQVPTRLTTHSRSQLNTPIRDRSNSSRTDTSEQF